jgi:Protein of unknown function (DUF3306)
MTAGRPPFSLSRWSRRKLAAATELPAPAPAVPGVVPAPATAPGVPTPPAALELPPVESLTFESDFTAFLRPEVDADLKRAALKQLFRDPRFNVMDGLDTYIDDYTKADPIPPDILADLLQRGFGRAPEAGPEPAAAVNAPRAGPAVIDDAQPAISEDSAHAATAPQPFLPREQAKRGAGEGDAARAGEPTDAKPADDSQ